jgi:hypothetical protein
LQTDGDAVSKADFFAQVPFGRLPVYLISVFISFFCGAMAYKNLQV